LAITEEARHRLYRRLEEILGPDEATILMEHLPPVGWADVATKRDLDHLEERFQLRLDSGLDRLRAEFHRDLRTQMIATIASQTAIATMLVAAVKLI
jgi:hypothetical protein